MQQGLWGAITYSKRPIALLFPDLFGLWCLGCSLRISERSRLKAAAATSLTMSLTAVTLCFSANMGAVALAIGIVGTAVSITVELPSSFELPQTQVYASTHWIRQLLEQSSWERAPSGPRWIPERRALASLLPKLPKRLETESSRDCAWWPLPRSCCCYVVRVRLYKQQRPHSSP